MLNAYVRSMRRRKNLNIISEHLFRQHDNAWILKRIVFLNICVSHINLLLYLSGHNENIRGSERQSRS